jgi:hypothetical protein
MLAVPHARAASCHLSHSYLDGACLYFTFAATPPPDEIESTYVALWDAGQRAVLAGGGNLSHHHGVGSTGVASSPRRSARPTTCLVAQGALDPNGILNPGKLGLPIAVRGTIVAVNRRWDVEALRAGIGVWSSRPFSIGPRGRPRARRLGLAFCSRSVPCSASCSAPGARPGCSNSACRSATARHRDRHAYPPPRPCSSRSAWLRGSDVNWFAALFNLSSSPGPGCRRIARTAAAGQGLPPSRR